MGTSVDRIKGLSSGLAVKAPVLAATTAAITLSGLQTIDGVAVPSGGRVLVKDQADATTNGVYDASTSAWQRSADADGANDFTNGTLVVVSGGTQGSKFWRLSSTIPVTVGTTPLAFVPSLDFASVSGFIATLFDDVDAAAARTTLGAASLASNTFTGDQTLGAGRVLVFEGSSDDAFETTLTVVNPTADRTVTIPNASMTVAGIDLAQTLTAVQTMNPTTASSASYTWATNTDPNLVLTTTGNLTLNAPTGLTIGAFYYLEVVYGGTHTITWNANFKGVTGLSITSTNGARDAFMFRAQTASVLELVGVRLNVGA